MTWLCWVYVGMWVVAVWRLAKGVRPKRGLDISEVVKKGDKRNG